MTILNKLHVIEHVTSIYDIHYSVDGVGFQFYDSGRIVPGEVGLRERGAFGQIDPAEAAWRKNLVIHRYYGSFEEAVEGEYQRLVTNDDAGWQLIHTTGE